MPKICLDIPQIIPIKSIGSIVEWLYSEIYNFLITNDQLVIYRADIKVRQYLICLLPNLETELKKYTWEDDPDY
jgi:hypothetical protein